MPQSLSTLESIDRLLVTAAGRAVAGDGLERSVALDDTAALIRLRDLVGDNPQLLRELEGGPTLLEWLEHRVAVGSGAMIEARDQGTTGLGGLTPPEYLTGQWLPSAGSRAAVDALTFPIPVDGAGVPTSLIYPRVTTPTDVVVQTAQNVAGTSSDIVVTDVPLSVATFTGWANLSRQVFQRQSPASAEATLRDLGRALYRRQSQQVIAGSGASGQLTGLAVLAGTTAATTTVTTAAGQISALHGVASTVAAVAGVGLEALNVVCHPRRLSYWLASGSAAREQGGGPFYVAGLRCYSDPSIRTNLGAGTNEDEILVAWPEATGWIEFTDSFSFEQAANQPGSVRVGIWSRGALVPRLPAAVGKLTGSGLVPVVF